jgi:glycosyltransferase involved in cell wall biosynthesis
MLSSTDGVENRGFVQPEELPRLMENAGAFVLPSRFEPWGVVVQEAAAAGLPVLCSTASGAGVHLVRDEYNGFQVESGSVEHLAETMRRMSALPVEERVQMGDRSHELSKQYTPERWARTFVEGVKRHKQQTVTA